ncbi:unnamed protein product, partial [Didymodactylos carnosus]
YIAKQFSSSRTLQQLIEQTKKGFNGDGVGHEGVSADMVRKMISHTHKYCNMLIDDLLLKGTIDDIKNADGYKQADEKEEDDDEDDDINTGAVNGNE